MNAVPDLKGELVVAMTRKLASLWVGAPFGPIEQISALSFLHVGHELVVYSDRQLDGLPPGVELRDANEILSTDNIVRHRKTGSPALYSDLFRYALLDKTDHTWVDLDVVALRPFPDDAEYLLAYQDEEIAAIGVLRLPNNSPALAKLLEFNVDTHGYPPYVKGFRRFRYMLKSFGRGMHISDWPWGAIGPRAVTHFMVESGEIRHVLPTEVFYPIPYRQAERFARPHDLTFDSFPEEALAVHLWGAALRRHIEEHHGGVLPVGSFLHKAMEKYTETSGFAVLTRMASG